ncbi:phosphoribosylanthranilate isomerase [Saccharopolyspora phatthalungensis]|uniref:N-(5'-phosphoribosyl)anthranilate isomerase n=1 Tax=Saccharopolyspora phatthalungensis TaxID=664693 RepID=A0A840Q406_9PSEU|nr:phosphoribosylanthranilate isomerase [Saccharopolyspora phatthalungensis]MBB5157232.1 phosphoribosylanthranilate isomerase [Saccharopolyspora phatthalungensis]
MKQAEDVECAVEAGANAVGFVLTESPRQVRVADVDLLVDLVPPGVLVVGVFQGMPIAQVRAIVAGSRIQAVQLHGGYAQADFAELKDLPVQLIRATSFDDGEQAQVGSHGEDYLILDSKHAGSGQTWDWSPLARTTVAGQWMLAGGLTPENVAEAIAATRPWGVDVSSGVESTRGVKDTGRIREFLAAARFCAG